jgi:hypothetical protein
MTSAKSGIKDFARAMFSRWLTILSGPLSVVPAALALWVPSEIAKILLVVTAFAGLWFAAYLVWKPERDKVVERDQQRRQLLDQISALRERVVQYRIDIERAYGTDGNGFDDAEWERRYGDLQTEIAARIEQLSSRAEASTYLHRGNITRTYRPGREGAPRWPVIRDVSVR